MKSSRGFSIIGSLLGFSLLGLSTVGLATYMGSFEQVKVTYAQQANVNFVHLGLLGSMQKIITLTKIEVTGADSKSDASHKKYGLCQAVTHNDNTDNTYDNFSEKIICPIKLKGTSIVKNDSSSYTREDRWKYFVQQNNDWTLVSADKCSKPTSDQKNGFVDAFTVDHLNKCVQYSGETQQEDIYARLSIIPQRLPFFTAISESDTDIPVDELTYKLKTMVSIPRELEPGNWVYSLSKNEKYLWSTEVLDCHVCDGSDCVLARFSTAAQGTAAQNNRICYHSPYEVTAQCHDTNTPGALDISIQAPSGEFLTTGPMKTTRSFGRSLAVNRIESSGSMSASAVCRSNLYRCGDSEAQDFDSALKFKFILNYDQPQDSYINKIDLTINGVANTHGIVYVDGAQQAHVGRTLAGAVKSFSDPLTTGAYHWPLKAGGNEVTAFMMDRDSFSSDNSICKNICSGEGSYYPELDVYYGGCGNPKKFSGSGQDIACVSCSKKSCHQSGANTYLDINRNGWNEPRDGVIPECAVKRSIDGPDTTEISGVSDDSNRCLKTADGGLQAVPCAKTYSSKPPPYAKGDNKSACFVNGMTQIMTHGNFSGLNAQLNCNKALQELHPLILGRLEPFDGSGFSEGGMMRIIADAYDLPLSTGDASNPGVKEVLTSENIGLITDGEDTSYTFNNYAHAPTFFGDHKMVNEADIYVPFQRDASGMFHSGWLLFQGKRDYGTSLERNDWAFFYREPLSTLSYEDPPEGILSRLRPSRPVYIKFDFDFPSQDQVSGNRIALVHHLRYKGIIPMNGGSYPYLCRNLSAGKYKNAFITANGNNGYDACRSLGDSWHFIPPDSRKLWAAALQAVAPNAPRYPFPNPFDFADGIPFWKELKHGDQGYDSKKNQWRLSYKYADMPAGDYARSKSMDDFFVFTKDTGGLANPAMAWIGGLKNNNDPANDPAAQFSIGSADKSWSYKPDWENLLEFFNDVVLDLELSDNYGSTPRIVPSLIFEEETKTDIQDKLNKLADDEDFDHDIGALNFNGRVMTHRSLRESGNLHRISSTITRICRYPESVDELDFHRALIVAGQNNSDWPGKEVNDCSEFDDGDTGPFLGIRSIYFTVPSEPGASELENLTGEHLEEIRQGLRNIVPLLSYHQKKATHVHNTEKFCRSWVREKKRRAIGNCLVDAYNGDTLSIGGVNHGLSISQNARGDASICHAGAVNCGGVAAYFQSNLNQDIVNRNSAIRNRDNAIARRNSARQDLISAQDVCDNATSCAACEDTVQKCRQTCWECRDYCIDNNPPGADRNACVSVCKGGESRCGIKCGCQCVVGLDCSCPTNWDCSERTTCQQEACDRIPGIEAQIRNEDSIISRAGADIDQLGLSIACQQAEIGNVSTSNCIASLDVDKHKQDYFPYTGSSCSSIGQKINFKKEDLPDTSYSKCWPIEDLPDYLVTFDGDTGLVGLVKDNEPGERWTKNADCSQDPRSLHSIPASCNNDYADLSDLDDKLCDDGNSVVDYENQTCVIP